MKPRTLFPAALLFGAALLACAPWGAGAQQPPAPQPGPPDAHGDPLPSAAALQRFGTVRFRHGDKILCLAYSPDGKILAAGGGTDPVRLWDAETGKPIRVLKDVWAMALAFSPNGNYLATAGGYKTVRVWEVASGRELFVLKGHTAAVKALAFSPDSTLLASGGGDKTVRLWNVTNGNPEAVYEGHGDEVNAVAFARDGKTIASGSGDRTVRIWNGKPARVLDAGCAVQALAYSPDGSTLASAGDDNLVRVWDPKNLKEIRKLTGHKDTVVSLAFADNKTLFSGGLDRTVRRWDVDKGEETLNIARRRGDCEALALSGDGATVACAGTDNTIRRFDARTGKERITPAGLQAGASSVAYSPDGKLVAAAGSDGEIRLWEAGTGKAVRNWTAPGGEQVLAFAPSGKALVSGGQDGVRVWAVADGKELHHLKTAEPDPVTCLAVGPGAKLIAVGYRHGGVRLWDRDGGKVAHQLRYPGGVRAVAVSADGKWVAGAGSGKIVLWDAATGQELRQIGKAAPVASLAFAPDGRKLAAGMFDSTIQVYNPADGAELKLIEGHTSAVYGLAFSPNGRVLASGSYDKTVRLWETVNGLQINSWPGHLGAVMSVSIDPRARRVLSGSADTTLVSWDVTGVLKDGELPEAELQPQDLDALWNDLASDDNPKGNRALWRMACGGKGVAPYLGKKVFLADPKRIEQYIKDLNDNKFAVRERATAALSSYGRWIEGVLREASKDPPSDEVRRRLERLLKALEGKGAVTLDQERLRARRVMEILEQAPTPPARELLASMSREAAEVDLRDAAAGALERLKHAKAGGP